MDKYFLSAHINERTPQTRLQATNGHCVVRGVKGASRPECPLRNVQIHPPPFLSQCLHSSWSPGSSSPWSSASQVSFPAPKLTPRSGPSSVHHSPHQEALGPPFRNSHSTREVPRRINPWPQNLLVTLGPAVCLCGPHGPHMFNTRNPHTNHPRNGPFHFPQGVRNWAYTNHLPKLFEKYSSWNKYNDFISPQLKNKVSH